VSRGKHRDTQAREKVAACRAGQSEGRTERERDRERLADARALRQNSRRSSACINRSAQTDSTRMK
jgi:hypothetical protein